MKKLIATSEIDFEALQHEYDILKEVTNKQNMNIINSLGMQRKKLDRTTIVMYILMELAESSKTWFDKLYYYGFIKPESKNK